ncbi:unnamed protein product [Sphenostylis stenocarpa]|uniref:Uncharacterized protein n=1 Tax=Sphenostylis stenocarpa TaxID=92480 RepID=A0AA86RXQ6_9FABA|nr:unnamed protein product [Sphenostylis stenocarpa]
MEKEDHEDPEKILRISKKWEEMPGKCSCRLEMKHLKRLVDVLCLGVQPEWFSNPVKLGIELKGSFETADPPHFENE